MRDRGLAVRRLPLEEILRHRQQNRTRPAVQSGRDGTLGERNHIAGFPRLAGPFHQRLEGADDIDLLERLFALHVASDLAYKGHQRGRVGHRRFQTNREIRGSRSPGRDHQAGAARQLRSRLGHERSRRLVPGGDDSVLAGGQGIDDRQDAFTGDREGDLHTRSHKDVCQPCGDRLSWLVLVYRHDRTPEAHRAGMPRDSARLTGRRYL